MDRDGLEREIEALDQGRGCVSLAGFRTVEVRGADAEGWLQDLVTADVRSLGPGDAVRSLLLGPTGRIRADVHVVREPEGFLLVQALDQPDAIDELLTPYVLSSEVTLRERPSPDLVAVPGLGRWRFRTEGDDLVPVSTAALETWRVRRGVARFPVDVDQDSLPAEAGLDDGVVIDATKGCFLGQESVAKVRNLGHPTRVVLSIRADGAVRPGDPVVSGGSEVGVVTSVEAAGRPGGVLVRVAWAARAAGLRTSSGVALEA